VARQILSHLDAHAILSQSELSILFIYIISNSSQIKPSTVNSGSIILILSFIFMRILFIFASDFCNRNWNLSFKQDEPGRVNVSWVLLRPNSPHHGSIYTYLVLVSVVNSVHSNVSTPTVNSSSAMVEFLLPNRQYSIRLVAFDTSNISSTTIHSCPHLVKTLDGR
jgi:hypothetical protein